MQRLVFTFFILSFSVFANELDAPSFTMFKQLLKEANRLQSVIGSRAISLLAPTNQAFKELSTEQINELINNKDELIAFVDYHIIEHSLSFNRLKNSKALKSKSNKLIKVSNKNSDILINDSFVLSVDVQRKGPTVVAIDKILNYQNQVSYNPQTEPNIDLNKYLGTWFEIGRFDHSFQEGCVSSKAVYKKVWAGISVSNSCLNEDGDLHQANGLAKVAKVGDNSKLKVSFVPFLKYFGFFSGDYLILKIDSGYQNVLIGDYSRKYLWVLSRSPYGNKEILEEYLEYASSLGYEVENFKISDPWPKE